MTDEQTSPGLTYKDAGVDIDAGNALVDRIKHISKATRRPEVLGGLGLSLIHISEPTRPY